jgi:hypothetical protein
VRCAVINGDLTTRLNMHKAEQAEEIPDQVTPFPGAPATSGRLKTPRFLTLPY